MKRDNKDEIKDAVLSRPAWGAWIETESVILNPNGVCVAPRMGRVD